MEKAKPITELDPAKRDPEETQRQWRGGLLRDLAEIGVGLMRRLHDQVTRFPASCGAASAPYAAISRSVRQTLMLEAMLAAEASALHSKRAAPPPQRPVPAQQRAVRQKDRVRFLVDKAIKTVGDRRRIEMLQLELDERMEDPAFDAGLGQQPVGLAVAGLCRELGITVDLSGFTAAELGMEEPTPQPASRGSRA